MTCDRCFGPANRGTLCACCVEDVGREEEAREARVMAQVDAYERELKTQERSAA